LPEIGRKASKGFYLVVKEVPGFDGIVDGVVGFVGLELVVLNEAMVGLGRKKQGRKEQRIDAMLLGNSDLGDEFAQVFQIVIENIVSANKGFAL
jgi:hypothetical protein